MWTGIATRHLKEYRKSDATGTEIVLEPTEEPARCIIFYRALVKVVELYADGRMMQGDASALTKGGWTFKIDEGERVRVIACAAVLQNHLLSLPTRDGAGLTCREGPDGSCCLHDERSCGDHRDRVW